MSKNEIRVRYAPSPTGLQHPGGIRTALFAWLFAKSQNGKFILRIEDTDKAREEEGAESYIYESLKWLGLDWDEGPDKNGNYGPYKQSERLGIYQKHAAELLTKGLAYADPYSMEEVENFRQHSRAQGKPFLFRDYRPEKPPEWKPGMPLRFRVPSLKSYSWNDEARGRLSAGPEALDDFIIIKSDSYPTYNFANVIDDHLMQISHTLRGEEYIASIPKYLSLYEALGWKAPTNVTMPLVRGKTGDKKLSKRDGSLPILEYREQGYLPVALNNFLATLGWNDGSEQEVFTTEELIDKFSIKRLQKAPARFDIERLNYLNGVHIRKLSTEELLGLSSGYWPPSASGSSDTYRRQILELIRERLKFLGEIPQLTEFFFSEDLQQPNFSKQERGWLEGVLKKLEKSDFSSESMETSLRKLAEDTDVSPGKLFMCVRQAVTGSKVSPGLFETLEVLGKDRTISRLRSALQSP